MSTETTEKVNQILEKSQIPDRYSFFQIEKMMIGKEPTAQAQYWAILRELEARRATCENYKRDLEAAEDDLELLDLKIERFNRSIRIEAEKKESFTDLNIQELEINIRKLIREKESLVRASQAVNKKLGHLIEEMGYLVSGHDKIVELYGPMKSFDDEEAQKQMWDEKLLEEFNLRVILQRPLDPEFIRTVMSLHDTATVKQHVSKLIGEIQNKMIQEKQQRQKQPSIQPKANITGR